MYKQVQNAYSSTLGKLCFKSYFSSLKSKSTHQGVLQLTAGCLWHTLSGCCTKCQHLIFLVATDPFVHIWNVMKHLCNGYSSLFHLITYTCGLFLSCFPLLCCSLYFTVNNKEYMNYFTAMCHKIMWFYSNGLPRLIQTIKSFYTSYMRNPQLMP